MTFEDLYDKVVDMGSTGACNCLDVVIEVDGGYKVITKVSIEKSIDGVGKFILLS